MTRIDTDFPFDPSLLNAAALYRKPCALDTEAMTTALNERLAPLGIAFEHDPEQDSVSQTLARAVLSHPSMHIELLISDDPLPLQMLSSVQTSPFLQTHHAGFSAIARRHVSHIDLRLGDGPAPDVSDARIPPALSPELCLLILHRALLALSEQTIPEAAVWFPTGLMVTPQELSAEAGSVLPTSLFIHPSVWTPGCDDEGRRLTGMIADHAEGWLGRVLELEPTAHSPEESRGILAYLLRQSLAGSAALTDGARVPLGEGQQALISHLPADETAPAGRISVRLDPPYPPRRKGPNPFNPLNILTSLGTALAGILDSGFSSAMGVQRGPHSIHAEGTQKMQAVGNLAIILLFMLVAGGAVIYGGF